jgi:hypothetical protein
VILALSFSLVLGYLQRQPESSLIADESTRVTVSESYGRLPLSFEANHGQAQSSRR